MATTKTTGKAAGSYNATVWRILASGQVLSTQAVEVQAGRVMRAGGVFSYDSGTAAFHGLYMAERATFAGEAVEVFVTPGTEGFIAAIGGSAKAWEARKAGATRLAA